MKAYIDRIEEKTAVVMVKGGGEVLVPLKMLHFKPYEGMHLTFHIKPDPQSQAQTEAELISLRKRLLRKSR